MIHPEEMILSNIEKVGSRDVDTGVETLVDDEKLKDPDNEV